MREARATRPVVLVAGAEPALAALIGEWLASEGLESLPEPDIVTAPADDVALVIVDVPFVRQGSPDLARLARTYAGVPIMALSSTVFGHVDGCGAVARYLGVAALLPKPLQRATLVAVVQHLLQHGRDDADMRPTGVPQ